MEWIRDSWQLKQILKLYIYFVVKTTSSVKLFEVTVQKFHNGWNDFITHVFVYKLCLQLFTLVFTPKYPLPSNLHTTVISTGITGQRGWIWAGQALCWIAAKSESYQFLLACIASSGNSFQQFEIFRQKKSAFNSMKFKIIGVIFHERNLLLISNEKKSIFF